MAASIDTRLLTNPIVRSAFEAWQGNDLIGWLACFAPGARLFDDGRPRDLKEFSGEIGRERFTHIDEVRDDAMTIVGAFHSGTWGDFKTYFKFHLNEAGEIDRLDIGQAD